MAIAIVDCGKAMMHLSADEKGCWSYPSGAEWACLWLKVAGDSTVERGCRSYPRGAAWGH